MRELFEMAEFLAASWKLANGDDRIPTSHGFLDSALFELRDQLPDRFHDKLSFGNTRVGFRCYELPQILYCAQANLLTSEPNPTYLTTTIQIDAGAARRLLKRQAVDVEKARAFGAKLKEAADRARASENEVSVAA